MSETNSIASILPDPSNTRPSYRALLLVEFQRRKELNLNYSLRAFARDLKLSASFLSDIFKGRRGLTETRARELAEYLYRDNNRKLYFLAVVQWENCPNPELREKLEHKLVRISKQRPNYRKLPNQYSKVLTEWYFDAIVELTEVPDFEPNAEWIANRLSISISQAKTALKALLQLSILEMKQSKLVKAQSNAEFPDLPSRLTREFHKRILSRAIRALDEQDSKTRKSRGITMAVDPNRLERANQMMEEFSKELTEFLEGGDRTAIYHFTLQLFRLDKRKISNVTVH